MTIQFSIARVDYECLLKHIEQHSLAYQSLLAAIRHIARNWMITCQRLAESGSSNSLMNSVLTPWMQSEMEFTSPVISFESLSPRIPSLDRPPAIVLLTAPSLRSNAFQQRVTFGDLSKALRGRGPGLSHLS
jgi:hypothetical protein